MSVRPTFVCDGLALACICRSMLCYPQRYPAEVCYDTLCYALSYESYEVNTRQIIGCVPPGQHRPTVPSGQSRRADGVLPCLVISLPARPPPRVLRPTCRHDVRGQHPQAPLCLGAGAWHAVDRGPGAERRQCGEGPQGRGAQSAWLPRRAAHTARRLAEEARGASARHGEGGP